MGKGRVSNRASWKYFRSSEKKWPTKAVLDRNKIRMEEFLILEFLMKHLFYSGALDIKWLLPIHCYVSRWLTITSFPERNRRIIVNYIVPTHLLPRTKHTKQIATMITRKVPPPEAAAINVNGSFPVFPDKWKKKRKKNSKNAKGPGYKKKTERTTISVLYSSIYSAFFKTWNWNILKMFLSLPLTQPQTSNFQFLHLLGYVSKNEKNYCYRCCCYSVPPPRIRQISRSYFLRHNQYISLAYPKSMFFLTIFGEVMFLFIKINWKCIFIFIKFARTWHRYWTLAFFGLNIYSIHVESVTAVTSS